MCHAAPVWSPLQMLLVTTLHSPLAPVSSDRGLTSPGVSSHEPDDPGPGERGRGAGRGLAMEPGWAISLVVNNESHIFRLGD